MSQHAEQGCTLAGVGSDGDDGRRVGAEDLVEDNLAPVVLGAAGLGGHTVPDLVVLAKLRVDLVGREGLGDVGAIGAVVAGVDADTLTEELLDGWNEGVVRWQGEIAVGVIGSLEASSEWGDIVRLRWLDLLGVKLMLPEDVVVDGLLNASVVEVSVFPGDGAVSSQLRIVALPQLATDRRPSHVFTYVPCWCTVESLRSVVVTLTVTANEQKLVHNVAWRQLVQVEKDSVEALPLSEVAGSGAVLLVGLVDEAEVGLSLRNNVSIQMP